MADVFSPYQIDYSVKNTSKTFGFSKKKVTFKFGVANPSAVDSGAAGADCRGSEHEVIFTWSLNSGKRQILADGKDVHYSETGLNGWTADQVFQHHFNIRIAGLAGPLRAHLITQPQNRDVPHIKPFDLRINGISYFSMPKIFELGSQQMITRPVKGKGRNRGGGGGGGGGRESDAYLSHEEKQAIAAAKLASLRDINHSQNQQYSSTGFAAAPVNDATEDLLNFDSPPAPVAPPQVQGGAPYGQPPPQSYSNYSLGTSMTGVVFNHLSIPLEDHLHRSHRSSNNHHLHNSSFSRTLRDHLITAIQLLLLCRHSNLLLRSSSNSKWYNLNKVPFMGSSSSSHHPRHLCTDSSSSSSQLRSHLLHSIMRRYLWRVLVIKPKWVTKVTDRHHHLPNHHGSNKCNSSNLHTMVKHHQIKDTLKTLL